MKSFKMLSKAQLTNTSKFAYVNGFRNVAFQVGMVCRLPGDQPNKIYLKTVDKNGQILRGLLPIRVPRGVEAPANDAIVKIICSATGVKDEKGLPQPVLIARKFERPNVFETEMRKVVDVFRDRQASSTNEHNAKESDHRLKAIGRINGATNTVELAGVVVGIQKRSGEFDDETKQFRVYPMVTLYLRQDADADNVIPVRFIDKRAESIAQKVGYGSLVYVSGEHRVLTEKLYEQNEDGTPKMNEEGQPIALLGADGKQMVAYHSTISIRHPAYPDSKDITFLDSLDKAPQWFIDMNLEMKARAERSRELAADNTKVKEVATIVQPSQDQDIARGDSGDINATEEGL